MFGGMGDLSSLHAPCASHLSRISLHDETNVSGDAWQYNSTGYEVSRVDLLTPSSNHTPLLDPHSSNATTQPPGLASGAALFASGGSKMALEEVSAHGGEAGELESMTSMSSMLKELDALLGIGTSSNVSHTNKAHAAHLELGPNAHNACTCPVEKVVLLEQEVLHHLQPQQDHKPRSICQPQRPHASAPSTWMEYGSSSSIAGFHYNTSSSSCMSHACSEDNVHSVLDLSWSMEHDQESADTQLDHKELEHIENSTLYASGLSPPGV